MVNTAAVPAARKHASAAIEEKLRVRLIGSLI
jgi:hypothetical protein